MTRVIAETLVTRLYQQAEAARWSLSRSVFTDALQTSLSRAFPGAEPGTREMEKYLSALHLKDLALACACGGGNDVAWEQFIRDHRPLLYRTADALDSTGRARELADALYADLWDPRARRPRGSRCSAISTDAARWRPGCDRCWRSVTSTPQGSDDGSNRWILRKASDT